MHKSKDITKYNIHWQVQRVKMKHSTRELEGKLLQVFSFFIKYHTEDNKERIINWLEGLAMGYKTRNPEKTLRVKEEIIRYEVAGKLKKEDNRISFIGEMLPYDRETLFLLYTDLFHRNSKWLKKGYNQREINKFMDNLYETLLHKSFPNSTQLQSLHTLIIKQREDADRIPNTHKFFF
jgi:hypothetical protein